MKLAQLREVLSTAGSHYRSDGRGDIADALCAFTTNLLKGDESETVSAFISRVKKARKPAVARTAGGSGRRRQSGASRPGSR
jgi:hypothetical protein